MKGGVLNYYSASLFVVKLLLITYLLQICLGFNIFDGDKRQALIPLSRSEKASFPGAYDDKSLAGGLIAYPRLGREVWELHKALIPYPRAGRLIVDPESLDYDIYWNPDDSSSGYEDSVSTLFSGNKPPVAKRPSMRLIPRIGRKKRSISDGEEKKEHEETTEENGKEVPEPDESKAVWNSLDGLADDYFFAADKKSIRSKNAFVPRIGKKWYHYLSDYGEKRAAAFTPRIGRAALIPRIGRSDPLFRLKSRAAFIPRIGRRAALVPRIGRSENQRTAKDDTD